MGASLSGYVTTLSLMIALGIWGVMMRGEESLQALAVGFEPAGLSKVEYVVSGAGMGRPGDIRVHFWPDWRN